MSRSEASKDIAEEQGQRLIQVARRTIAARLGTLDHPEKVVPDRDLADPAFREKRGTFVTLKLKGQLRGCMGCLTPSESILEGIQRNAINSAFNDPRFPALSATELDQAKIDISILTEPRDLEYTGAEDLLKKLRCNIDGVIIKKGGARATFLPQVWEQLPRTENFLACLCQKAGLTSEEWKKGELIVSIYQVQYFNENI